MREAMIALRKIPADLAHLADLPADTSVVHIAAPHRPRRLEALEFHIGRNRWFARLDGGSTCEPAALRLPGQQLDLLAPAEGGRAWV